MLQKSYGFCIGSDYGAKVLLLKRNTLRLSLRNSQIGEETFGEVQRKYEQQIYTQYNKILIRFVLSFFVGHFHYWESHDHN